ncbi:hypothetical protein D3C81_2196400 [compost metagenome]
MLQMNWDALYELLYYYQNDIDFLTYSDLLELNDKVTDIQDNIQKRLDSFEDV